MTPRPDRRLCLVAVAAIAWLQSFAGIHLAWALGSTGGLGGHRVTGVPLAIDIVRCGPLAVGWVTIIRWVGPG